MCVWEFIFVFKMHQIECFSSFIIEPMKKNRFQSLIFHVSIYSLFFPQIAYHFQENLLRTMIQIENTYFELGKSCSKNCLIICDRGVMDASACKYKYNVDLLD